ncbi:MAG TPA: hypothetical protein VJH90_01715 [archaeon]|nr:hypothetical protein [archaeon]
MSQDYTPVGMRINPALVRGKCTECREYVSYNEDAVLFDLCLRAMTKQSVMKKYRIVSGVTVEGDIRETAHHHLKDPWKRTRHIYPNDGCPGTPEAMELLEEQTWTLPDGKLRLATLPELDHIGNIVEHMHRIESKTPTLEELRSEIKDGIQINTDQNKEVLRRERKILK